MNKRGIIVFVLTTMLLTATNTNTTNHNEFSTPKVKIADTQATKTEIKPTEETKPLTVKLAEKEIKTKDVEKTILFDGQMYRYRKVNIVATHYTSSVADCGNTKGVTASGVRASRGMVAVPHNIPFGTQIVLEDEQGNKQKVIAQDRGGAIKWINEDTMKIDVFVPNATKKQILDLGVKKYTGYILEKIVETP